MTAMRMCAAMLSCAAVTAALGQTTVVINPTNQTGGNVNDFEIHGNGTNITNVNPNPIPPFTRTDGMGTKKVTFSGGTLANGGTLPATVTLAANKSSISHYTWTINGQVIGSSITPYSGVPVGVTANDCHIKTDQQITAVKVIEPPGWTATVNGNKVDLTGPAIGQGTNVKVEIYVAGHNGPIVVSNFTWTSDGRAIANSTPVLCFNDTEVGQGGMMLMANAPITNIEPMPPLPFTEVQGLGTPMVLLTGATLPPGHGAGDRFGVVQVESVPGLGEEFFVQTQWLPAPACPGDANCDGRIDFEDINPFVAVLSGAQPCRPENCDINGDGRIDFEDINPFVEVLGSGWSCP
ncbi:MAG: hypothetical protein AB1716_07665 [Planctomycetota bacterium]